MRFDVATAEPDPVLELPTRGVESVADSSVHVVVVLPIDGDLAAGRLEVDPHGELRCLMADAFDNHATAHEALIEVLQPLGVLANDLVQLIGAGNVSQRDLQRQEHGLGMLQVYAEYFEGDPGHERNRADQLIG